MRINRKGFTLIEVLLVIFIMFLSVGIVLSSFKDTKPIDEVEAATRRISALVREAQNNSLSGKQQMDGGTLSNICRNAIEWDGNSSDSTSFTLFSYKSAPPSACDVSNGRIDSRTETFKKVNVETFVPANSAIFFNVPNGNASVSGFTFPVQFKVVSTVRSEIFALVCVYSNGRIEEFFGTSSCP